MNIIGLDALVFGVDDLAACRQYLIDYGLRDAGGDRFEALDGTAVVVRAKDDASLQERMNRMVPTPPPDGPEPDYGGVLDGNQVISDADPGL